MSSLKWEQQVRVLSGTNQQVYEAYWELWGDNPLREREWYDYPEATVCKLKDRVYELELADDKDNIGALKFKTLKAAKAMGIALVKMKG